LPRSSRIPALKFPSANSDAPARTHRATSASAIRAGWEKKARKPAPAEDG
jgi:hypothetical protein